MTPVQAKHRPLTTHKPPTASPGRSTTRGRHRRRSAALVACAASESRPGPPGAFDEPTKAQSRQKLFNNIAPEYDELNDLLSAGQHRVWKRMAVGWSGARRGGTALDICCGSGDLARLLSRAVGPSGSVIGLDFAQDMLDYAAAQARAGAAGQCDVRWTLGDALNLPFPDASFDAVTMGFGLRNVADIPTALREVERVLKPGASAAILDFNNSENGVIDGVQGFLLEQVVVPAARQRGLAAEYEYLRPSIKAFPIGEEQEALARAAGFAAARHYEISFGLMGCLVVQKVPFAAAQTPSVTAVS